MKTLFILSIIALVIAVGMSAFTYMEIQKLKEINDVDYYHFKKMSSHWESWHDYEIDHWGQLPDHTYKKVWTKQIRDSQKLEREWMNDIGKLLYP